MENRSSTHSVVMSVSVCLCICLRENRVTLLQLDTVTLSHIVEPRRINKKNFFDARLSFVFGMESC